MANMLFEEFQTKKTKLKTFIEKAATFKWISKEEKEELIEKLENNILTIGVIGQMKCGKSTFLNSFVFEDNILPAASTPMTAALSVITYGKENELEAEFYSTKEWEEMKANAAKDKESVSEENEKSKIEAAQQLVKGSEKLGSSLSSFLGSSKKDDIKNLKDYVGAEGKFTPITKSVKIYSDKEYLKGVEIVDTPGTNDPIVSREERTKEFLSKADAVLLLLYVERAFDQNDRNLLFDNVRKCGAGRILIGINKYELSYQNGANEEDVIKHIASEIKKACDNDGDDTIADILKRTTPVCISSGMALLSNFPLDKIKSDESFNHLYNLCCNTFQKQLSDKDLKELSHIEELEKAILEVIENEKYEIMFAKPINFLKSKGSDIEVKIKQKLSTSLNELKILKETNLDKLNDDIDNVERTKKKIEKKLERLKDFILNNIVIEKIDGEIPEVEALLQEGYSNILETTLRGQSGFNFFGLFGKKSIGELQGSINNKINRLFKTDLARKLKHITTKIKNNIKDELNEYFEDLQNTLSRNIKEFDYIDFIESVENKIIINIDRDININLFSAIVGNENFLDNYDIENGWFSRNSDISEMQSAINDLRNKTTLSDIESYFEPLKQKIAELLDIVVNYSTTELLDPLKEKLEKQIAEIEKGEKEREDKIKAKEEEIQQLENEKTEIEKQIKELIFD
ncbi:MAG: dynamin family protein [Spirochaetota bacterium]|nr:dynamin family protein [Spirochaetota bacterium]